MPVCPGCEQVLSHERLPVHQRCCLALGESTVDGSPATAAIEECLRELEEHLAEEHSAHEAEVERRLRRLENKLRVE